MKRSEDIAQLYKMLTDDIDRQNPAAAGPMEPCSGFSDRRLVEVFRRDQAARPASTASAGESSEEAQR